MKKLYYLLLTPIIFSCSGNESVAESNTDNNAETTEVMEKVESPDNTAEPLAEAEVIPLKEKSQVNDYAEYFLQSKIGNSYEDIDADKGEFYYFQVLDVKNGYAIVTGAFEGEMTFVVWRMANGNDLVGKTTMSCGPVCDYSINFYEITAEGDKDVTATIVPTAEIEKQKKKMEDLAVKEGVAESKENAQLLYVLPQNGTSIEVYLSMQENEIEFPIVTLGWDKTKFSISKKYNEITGGN